MQETVNNTSQDSIYTEAAEWMDRLSDGELNTLCRKRFIKWLEADVQHQQVFESMLATWQDPALEQSFEQLKKRQKRPVKKASQWGMGLATACALVVAITVMLPGRFNETSEPTVFTAQSPMENTHQLSDGSALQLQLSSEVKVNYSEQQRDLRIESGQAYFSVAKDKKRPFVVSVGDASVTAVGTEFNIDRGTDQIDVTVYEGIVEVQAEQESFPVLLKAGEKMRLSRGRFGVVQKVDVNNLIDWRSGWIEISNENLTYLIERLNRHSSTPIVLADPNLGSREVAGRFRLNDTEQTLKLLSQMYALNVEYLPQQIRLTP